MIPCWIPDSVTTVPDRFVEQALLWGIEALELQTVGGASDRVPNVNVSRLERLLDRSELAVAAVVPGLFEGPASDRASWMNDLHLLDEVLSFCRRLSCGLVVVSPFSGGTDRAAAAEPLRRAGDRAGKAGITLAVLNSGDTTCPTGRDLADLLHALDHAAVRAAWDPAAAAAAGEPVSLGTAAVGSFVELVRHRPEFAESGAVLGRLGTAGFRGPVSLDMPPRTDRAGGLRAATAMIRVLRSAQSPSPT